MPLPQPTVEELISALKRSTLPTLIVEGTTDASVYRLIERTLRFPGGTVLPAGNRAAVFEIYRRRAELSHLKVAFLADKDMWVFGGVPAGYEGIRFTTGYSIENDLLDGPILGRLCDHAEQAHFSALLDELARWFAYELQEWRAGRDTVMDVSAMRLVPVGVGSLDPGWIQSRGFTEPQAVTLSEVRGNARMGIRGKQVLDLAVRMLNAPTRQAKHSRESIIEICATSPDHTTCRGLIAALQAALKGE